MASDVLDPRVLTFVARLEMDIRSIRVFDNMIIISVSTISVFGSSSSCRFPSEK